MKVEGQQSDVKDYSQQLLAADERVARRDERHCPWQPLAEGPRCPSPWSSAAAPRQAAGEPGASAYDGYPEPRRSKLVKDWGAEVEMIRKAIEDDEERAKKATTRKERRHFERLVEDYERRLEVPLKNDPPFMRPEEK